MTNNLFISIITPSLNRADMIGPAIESVIQQDYPNFEHIIVDGGSTDGTIELLNQYPHLKVVIKRDEGMYDALNKGLELAEGEIIGFLNSDDRYNENVFPFIGNQFNNQDTMGVVGTALVFIIQPDGEMKIIRDYSTEWENLIELVTSGAPVFNAWFFRRSLFEKIGNFNIKYQIAGDREFMLRFALSNQHYQIINQQVYQYLQHSGSMTFDPTAQQYERISIEHIDMSEYYLLQNDLPPYTHSLIQQLHTRETIKMAVISVKTKKLRDGFKFFKAGLKYDHQLPFKFMQQVLYYLWSKSKSTQ